MFQTRQRRPRYGELVQIDGSPHAWFEDRGPRCTLIVFIDDATSRLMALHFVPSETTRSYLETLRDYILNYGRPLALYSDRHGIFRVNAKEAESGDGKTEFGRVVERLEIASIQAGTPQAKGRVERSNQTLQDRLVKEMRLRNISSMEAGNTFAASFIAFWNERFAVPPRDAKPAHRPWTDTAAVLEDALARREKRTLSKALTFSTAGTKYCVKTDGPGTCSGGPRSSCITSSGRDGGPLQGPRAGGDCLRHLSGPGSDGRRKDDRCPDGRDRGGRACGRRTHAGHTMMLGTSDPKVPLRSSVT